MRYFLALIALVAFDFFVKSYVDTNIELMGFHHVYPYGGIGVFENLFGGIDFSINYIQNTGAAWGMLSGFSSFLFIFRIILCIPLVYLLYKRDTKIAFLMILAGALGNIIDFAFHGFVIDMFHFSFWGYSFPVFNIADSLIFLGVFVHIFMPWKDSSNKPDYFWQKK